MSGLDQPLLIANSNYHVGQQTSVRVAEEQGYFREEGLAEWVYDCRGLIPGALEREGLALVLKEHGVDVATAVDLPSILHQRQQGADLYVVGGWRFAPPNKVFGARHITALSQLRGKRIGNREAGGMGQQFLRQQLRKAGIDPDTEVEWVFDRVFSYGFDRAQIDMLAEGRVDAMSCGPPLSKVAEDAGFPVLLDPLTMYPGGKPGKVIVATGRVIEQRRDELAAFLRANIRAFWFMRDPDHTAYLQDLEERLRRQTHNDDERYLRIASSVERVEGWTVPVTGGIAHQALEQVIAELVEEGELERPIPLEDVLRDDTVTAAYRDVSGRPALRAAHEKALAAVAKWGY